MNETRRNLEQRAYCPHRIAIHDYCGHPFQFGLSRELARRGHEVRHFFFADDAGPKGKTERSSADPDGFSVEPISIGRPYSKNNLMRRRQADVLYGKLASDRIAAFAPDVVISGNTPLEAQAPILKTVHRAGSAFVFWMQDFYGVAAAKLLSQKIPILGHAVGTYYKHLEAMLLRRSDGVVLIDEGFRSALHQLGVDETTAEVIPNWGALDELPLRPKNTTWARHHQFSDKFVFLYSGTLGLKHNPELLWALAEHFEHDPDVLIAVAASGVSYERLKDRCASEPKPNLVFLPLQPMDVFPNVLGSADVLVALLERDAGAFSVPSKVLNYLCGGRPILLSAPLDNLAVRVVEKAAAGVSVPAGDKEAFLKAADHLRKKPQLREKLGAAGRAYAESVFDISVIADRFEKALGKAATRRHVAGPQHISRVGSLRSVRPAS
jgi:colanic acid biosynthesis glycosyl transferase WcaI